MSSKYRLKMAAVIAIFVIVSFISIYAGRFLFMGEKISRENSGKTVNAETSISTAGVEQTTLESEPFPVVYRHISRVINGEKQEINLLEIDVSNDRVEILPVLSHDNVHGFETLSGMVQRKQAYAAVNGGFFHEYGEPSGMVMIRGKMIRKPSGKYPVLIIDGKKAILKELSTQLYIKTENRMLKVDDINNPGKAGQTILYTPVYGSSTRSLGDCVAATIINNTVTKIAPYTGKVAIPENDGMLLACYVPNEYNLGNFPLRVGDYVNFIYEPGLGADAHAYECGSWVVKDGEVVIKKNDEWIGVTTNRDPRTVVGLKDDKTLILLTVDGRQPGYSAGLTGKELGKLLLELGVSDAAMLDGGASTEMIVDGKVVNRPSFKGQERPLGGAIAVILKD